MAAPISTVTVNFDIPMLAQLVQSNNDLRREVSDLRTQLSARLDTIEARLPQQATRSSLAATPAHEDRYADEPHYVNQDLDVHTNGFANETSQAQDDLRDSLAQEQNLTNGHDLIHDSSPSVDEQDATVDPASPLPIHSKKRKRTVKSATSKSPYINHSGFVVRSSDNQLAQRRLEESRPSRSESPIESNEDVHESSDRLDIIPPTRPQSKARASPPKQLPQRPQTVFDDTDETATPVPQEVTLRYDHCCLDCV